MCVCVSVRVNFFGLAAAGKQEKQEAIQQEKQEKQMPSSKEKKSKKNENTNDKEKDGNDKDVLDQAYKFSKFRAFVHKKKKLEVGYFNFIQVIGKGSFSSIIFVEPNVKAAQSKHVSFVCKVMKKEKVIAANMVQMIRREETILKTLNHPFLTYLVASFQDRSRVFQIMEFAPGGSLFDRLGKKTCFALDVCKFYAGTVLLGLEFLQSKDIAHRDIKPENILLNREDYPVLINFSFAKVLPPGKRTYTLCGTPDYMSPEVIQGQSIGATQDYWAYGVLLYEMAHGSSPFSDEDDFIIFQRVLQNTFIWPNSIKASTKKIVSAFLKPWTERLGCSSEGAKKIKHHEWFRGFNFDAAAAMKMKHPTERIKPMDINDLRCYPSFPNTIDDCKDVDIEQEEGFDPSFGTDENVFVQAPAPRRTKPTRDSTCGLYGLSQLDDEDTEGAEVRVLKTMDKENRISRKTLRAQQTEEFEENNDTNTTATKVGAMLQPNFQSPRADLIYGRESVNA